MFKYFQVKMSAMPANLLKKRFWPGVFLWIFWNLRTPFDIEHLRWLLLIKQLSPLNQWSNKYTWFSCKIFVFHRKWKIRNIVVLGMQSAAHIEAFLIKQGMLFFAHLQCFRHVRRPVRVITCLICRSLRVRLHQIQWHEKYFHVIAPCFHFAFLLKKNRHLLKK